jgi:hypothetical protein
VGETVAALRPPDEDALERDAELGHGESLCATEVADAIAFPRPGEAVLCTS